MILALWRLTRGYRLRPWKSPYLRWRLETYWCVHADRIGFREFWWLAWRQRKPLFRYLRWAAEMNRARHRAPEMDSGVN